MTSRRNQRSEYTYFIQEGWIEAALGECSDTSFFISASVSDQTHFFLYNRTGKWFTLKKISGVITKIELSLLPDVTHDMFFLYAGKYEDGCWKMTMLRNTNLEVPEIAKAEVADKRSLFREPFLYNGGWLQFFYEPFGDFGVSFYPHEEMKYLFQIRNELREIAPLMRDSDFFLLDSYCIQMNGKLLGLYCGDFFHAPPGELDCICPGDISEVSPGILRLRFKLSPDWIKGSYYVVWMIEGRFYPVPLFPSRDPASSDCRQSLEEYLSKNPEPLGNLDASFVSSAELPPSIELENEFDDLEEARLVVFSIIENRAIADFVLPVINGGIGPIRLQKLADARLSFEKPETTIWGRLTLLVRSGKDLSFYYLKNKNTNMKGKRTGSLFDERCFYEAPVGSVDAEEARMLVVPYMTVNYRLSVKYVIPEYLYRSQFSNELLDVSIKNNVLYVKLKCRPCGGEYTGIVTEYRSVRFDEREEHFIPYTNKKVLKDGSVILTAHVDLKKYYMRMLYWDIRSAFEIDGQRYTVANYSNNEHFLKKYKRVFVGRSYPQDNSIIFPYGTDNHSVALMHRETCRQDHWDFRLKEKIAAIVYKLFKDRWDRKNIFLVFEKYCTMAQDNGFYFFEYCMKNDLEKKYNRQIYYVIDKNSSDMPVLEPYMDHVIPFLSFRHMLALQACRTLISTDTKGHAYVWRSMGSIFKALPYGKPLIFLQHGVTAFKRGHFEKNTGVGCECFITTSEFEQNIICSYLGYPEEEVPITGFARWDVLHDKSEGHREILLMPTWRTWLDDVENDLFAQSDYCKNYMALLNDPRLDQALKEKDITLNFYIHPKFRKFIREFSTTSEQIVLIPFGEVPLNELMMTCNLLITDFSSVAWDVYYMKKPVLFYHFDIDIASNTLGFYMDMKNDLFGERAEDPETLVKLILEYVERDFRIKEENLADYENYFAFVDDHNSERIWNAIMERGY